MLKKKFLEVERKRFFVGEMGFEWKERGVFVWEMWKQRGFLFGK